MELPHPEITTDTMIVTRSVYANAEPPAAVGTRVKSEFAFFGTAYAAIRHGNYEAAVAEFKEMANYYPIENDALQRGSAVLRVGGREDR